MRKVRKQKREGERQKEKGGRNKERDDCYKGYIWNNWYNLNVECVLNYSTVSMSNSLNLTTISWKRMFTFFRDTY